MQSANMHQGPIDRPLRHRTLCFTDHSTLSKAELRFNFYDLENM